MHVQIAFKFYRSQFFGGSGGERYTTEPSGHAPYGSTYSRTSAQLSLDSIGKAASSHVDITLGLLSAEISSLGIPFVDPACINALQGSSGAEPAMPKSRGLSFTEISAQPLGYGSVHVGGGGVF